MPKMSPADPIPWPQIHSPDKAMTVHVPAQPSPLIFSVPHSGRYYPDCFKAEARPKGTALRTSEDAYVDNLIGFGPDMTVAGLRLDYARAFVDVNRHPLELDARLIRGRLPAGALSSGTRVMSGYGVVPRRLNADTDIYSQPIDMAEVERRIELIHRPYHATLAGLVAEARRAFGQAVLIDWHSMPSASVRSEGRQIDIVLGDRHGESCGRETMNQVRAYFEGMGLKVALNKPFAGGYILQTYGRPASGVEAVQIEINRALYMDEVTLEPLANFPVLSEVLRGLAPSLRLT